MKKYSSLIQQYKTQDLKKALSDNKNNSLQHANCFDDNDDCFDLGTLCDCTSAGCAFTGGCCDGLNECLGVNDYKYCGEN